MANMVDYIKWRGDLSIERVRYCEVDALILAFLSYLPYKGIVPERFSDGAVTLSEALDALLNAAPVSAQAEAAADNAQLLTLCRDSERLGPIGITGFVEKFSGAEQEQFSASTALLSDGTLAISYRGTDGSLVGWKENFNMAFAPSVPAQRDAVEYLVDAARYFDRPIRLGGHSKGGNLAVYAAAFCPESVLSRIIEVCNFDGPGFNEQLASSGRLEQLEGRVRTYLPESSIVGVLLEQARHFIVVESTAVGGIAQHDVRTWKVMRDHFITLDALSGSSLLIDETLKNWTERMPPEKRKQVIDAVYSVLSAAGDQPVEALLSGKNALPILAATLGMDAQTRLSVLEAFGLLAQSFNQALPDWLAGRTELGKKSA